MEAASLAGHLLVATPLLGDPNFERTAVLLLTHGDDGAFGVVLNRPSETEVLELVPAWAGAAAEPSLMFLGGPVGQSAVVGLGVVDGPPDDDDEREGWQRVVGSVGTIDLNLDPADVTTALAGVRLFAGSAGWMAGQLEGEIEDGAWWVFDSEPGDVVSSEPADLWERVLRRQPQPTSFFAVYPPDPLVN